MYESAQNDENCSKFVCEFYGNSNLLSIKFFKIHFSVFKKGKHKNIILKVSIFQLVKFYVQLQMSHHFNGTQHFCDATQ